MSALPHPDATTSAFAAAGDAEVEDDVWQRLDDGSLMAVVYDRQFKRQVEVSIERDDSFAAPYDVVERGGPYKLYWIGYREFDEALRAAERRRAEIASRVPVDEFKPTISPALAHSSAPRG